MTAQLRFSRIDVTDRFPMVALKIRDDGRPSQAEVAIGTDPALFKPDGKKDRNAANFYSTKGNGAVRFAGNEANFIVPPEVLARFIGNEKLYVGVATAGEGDAMKVAVTPTEASPYISIKGLSGRSLARVRVIPNRQQRAAGYGKNGQAQLEWAGDTATPGMAPVEAGTNGATAPVKNGKANGSDQPAAPVPYDDGFGPLPAAKAPTNAAPAPAPAAAPAPAPTAQGLDDDPESHGIDGPAYTAAPATLGYGQARSLSAPNPDYDRVARFVVSPAVTGGRGGKAIDRIVIHITDAPTTSSTVNHFSRAGANSSAHYLVGQDGEIVQFVPEADTAWHAKGANQRSIGIEHVAVKAGGVDYDGTHFDALAPSDTQYCESAALVTALCDKYGLTPDRTTIIGHREADTGTSHTSCPDGNWNWDHFMDLVTNRYCKAQPAATNGTAQGLSLKAKTNGRYPQARAMVVGAEDRQRVRQLAADYKDLFQWSPAPSLVAQVKARGFTIQRLDAAVGDLNCDFYKVVIKRFPDGWDAPKLLGQFIRNIKQFVDTGITDFSPYDDSDAQRLASDKPLGAAMFLDIKGRIVDLDPTGWDNAAIVISEAKPQFYAVTTINTPRSGDHPVSGHRQFGYFVVDGVTTFYTRGTDRATLGFPGTETLIFAGGERLWESFQSRLAAFINDKGGEAEILAPFSERFNPTAIREELGGFETAQALAARKLPAGRGLSADSFTINWDEVQQIAQPTDVSCWATAASMVLGWRDRMSLTVEGIAANAGLTTATGLDPAQVGQFATDMKMTAEPPRSYTVDAFRKLIEANGPLWVGAAVPGLHAIVVTGLYAEGDETYVRITDPWDRDVGSPGAPGAYATSHATGSRYIMRWADFVAEYERAATDFAAVNLQVLHCGGTFGHQLNTGSAAGAGYALGLGTRAKAKARALGGAAFTLNWDDVELIAQPTEFSCWAAAGAIVVGWRDMVSLSPEAVGSICGRSTATGLAPGDVNRFAGEMGLSAENPMCYAEDGFRDLLERNGPLWVAAAVPGLHAIVVTGMYSDGTETYVRVADPWDRAVGTPGAPGGYAATHTTGSRYIMTYRDFTQEYENAAGAFPGGGAQILHSGGTGSRQPNRGPTAPAGYAMANLEADRLPEGDAAPADADLAMAPPPPPRTRAMEVLGTIGGLLPQLLSDSSGDISWELDQFRGLKHPGDKAPANPAPFSDATTIRLDDWPKLTGWGIDDIYAWFTVDWQYNGKSLGNVRIGNIGTNDAKLMKLKVRAQIMDDAVLYEPGGIAALKVRFHYRFSRTPGDDIIAVTDLQLFADGTYLRDGKYLQKSTI